MHPNNIIDFDFASLYPRTFSQKRFSERHKNLLRKHKIKKIFKENKNEKNNIKGDISSTFSYK